MMAKQASDVAEGQRGLIGKFVPKLERVRMELRRKDLDRVTQVLRLAELAVQAAGLEPHVALGHERIYELTEPPKPFRGLRDLVVRLATPSDMRQIVALTDTPAETIRARFKRGDLAYVGLLGDRLLAQSWFHRGPEPFVEDVPLFPRWHIESDTFWSYHAYTHPEAQKSGLFVKLFQVALHEHFTQRKAARIRCMVKASNLASVQLHERLKFRRLGDVTSFAVSGVRIVNWRDDGGSRRWFQLRDAGAIMRFPPL
jgi:RimJ/RimL family protein N-acetyltransferase